MNSIDFDFDFIKTCFSHNNVYRMSNITSMDVNYYKVRC